ncbi:hypothetical protein [Rhodococcus qingshengii]|uniref:hypothetical protein n=1 Tax=Rhodococcus erythropolis TaxID=1833 RepID=UPI0035AFFB25
MSPTLPLIVALPLSALPCTLHSMPGAADAVAGSTRATPAPNVAAAAKVRTPGRRELQLFNIFAPQVVSRSSFSAILSAERIGEYRLFG